MAGQFIGYMIVAMVKQRESFPVFLEEPGRGRVDESGVQRDGGKRYMIIESVRVFSNSEKSM